MADISNVNTNEIKDLYECLENLSCKWLGETVNWPCSDFSSSHYDPGPILEGLPTS